MIYKMFYKDVNKILAYLHEFYIDFYIVYIQEFMLRLADEWWVYMYIF